MTEIECKYRDWFKETTGCDPTPDCENCIGCGVFADDGNGNPTEPCIFCIEDYEAAHPIEEAPHE